MSNLEQALSPWRRDLELISLPEVCVMFGGLHRSSVYRLVRRGVIPKPAKIGSSSRWLKSECLEALGAMLAVRS